MSGLEKNKKILFVFPVFPLAICPISAIVGEYERQGHKNKGETRNGRNADQNENEIKKGERARIGTSAGYANDLGKKSDGTRRELRKRPA